MCNFGMDKLQGMYDECPISFRPIIEMNECFREINVSLVYDDRRCGMNKMAASRGGLPARKEVLNRLENALKKFPPLLERTLVSCDSDEEVSEGKRKVSEFRVMQWNILADG